MHIQGRFTKLYLENALLNCLNLAKAFIKSKSSIRFSTELSMNYHKLKMCFYIIKNHTAVLLFPNTYQQYESWIRGVLCEH